MGQKGRWWRCKGFAWFSKTHLEFGKGMKFCVTSVNHWDHGCHRCMPWTFWFCREIRIWLCQKVKPRQPKIDNKMHEINAGLSRFCRFSNMFSYFSSNLQFWPTISTKSCYLQDLMVISVDPNDPSPTILRSAPSNWEWFLTPFVCLLKWLEAQNCTRCFRFQTVPN